MDGQITERLIDLAKQASERSYSPYSHFPVGAAVLAASGKIYAGTNIENASYGATMCAERVAVFKAISEGEKEIAGLAVYAGAATVAFPCGMCLQVLSEFAGDIPVFLSSASETREYRLSDLLPHPFGEV